MRYYDVIIQLAHDEVRANKMYRVVENDVAALRLRRAWALKLT